MSMKDKTVIMNTKIHVRFVELRETEVYGH